MMNKQKFIGLVGAVFLLAGCIVQPAQSVPQQPLAPAAATQTPYVQYVTATPEMPTLTTEAVLPSATPVPDASITVSKPQDQGGGNALIEWTSQGDFPSGFVVVWSTTNQKPVYPNDQYVFANSSAAHSAMIASVMKKIVYLRVCRLTGDRCDVYSNLDIFALTKAAPPATSASSGSGSGSSGSSSSPTTAYDSNGNVVNSSTMISITGMSAAGTGKAQITWTTAGSFPSGFRIVYSTSSATPYVGGYPYYAISNGSTTTAYVDGLAGTTYHFRICRTTGTTCDIYSNSFTYTFPGTAVATSTSDYSYILLTGIDDESLGKAIVYWYAIGNFPSGFKLLYSKTNTSPTLSDSVVAIPDWTARSVEFTGTPGSTYHVRLCKYLSGSCAFYSNSIDYTFPADSSTITITSVTNGSNLGEAVINWDASGDFSNGFKILASQTNTSPVLSDTILTVSDGTARTATYTQGMPGATYHFRICKFDGSACTVYSTNTVDLTLTTDPAVITITSITDSTPGNAVVNWTASTTNGDFSGGFKILASTTNTQPTLADAVGTASGTDTAYLLSGTPNTNYYIRICKYFNGGCSAYSDSQSFTFAATTP